MTVLDYKTESPIGTPLVIADRPVMLQDEELQCYIHVREDVLPGLLSIVGVITHTEPTGLKFMALSTKNLICFALALTAMIY